MRIASTVTASVVRRKQRLRSAGPLRFLDRQGQSILNKTIPEFVVLLPLKLVRCRFLSCVLAIARGTPALAQSHRSTWMWSSSSHPFGSVNVIGNEAPEHELISDFAYWGFDRIYTSVGDMPLTIANSTAFWNTALDNANISSQSLYGLVYFTPAQMATLVQTKLIDFNNSRVDPRERFDAVHLDLEPQGTSEWSTATPADKHAMLLNLRDTYAAIRTQLDNNGCPYVKVYADLPVWFDSMTSNLGWANQADRNQWFDDVGLSLDGITMMAYERSTLSSIVSGVGYEVANFNGEVRIGLNASEVGPGKTFADYDALIGMADSLEAYYGANIGGIDFHPLTTFSDLAPARPPGDYNGDGTVNAADYTVWRDNLGSTTKLAADGDFNGVVNTLDYELWRTNYGTTGSGSSWPTAATIPEPASLMLFWAGLATMFLRQRTRS